MNAKHRTRTHTPDSGAIKPELWYFINSQTHTICLTMRVKERTKISGPRAKAAGNGCGSTKLSHAFQIGQRTQMLCIFFPPLLWHTDSFFFYVYVSSIFWGGILAGIRFHFNAFRAYACDFVCAQPNRMPMRDATATRPRHRNFIFFGRSPQRPASARPRSSSKELSLAAAATDVHRRCISSNRAECR